MLMQTACTDLFHLVLQSLPRTMELDLSDPQTVKMAKTQLTWIESRETQLADEKTNTEEDDMQVLSEIESDNSSRSGDDSSQLAEHTISSYERQLARQQTKIDELEARERFLATAYSNEKMALAKEKKDNLKMSHDIDLLRADVNTLTDLVATMLQMNDASTVLATIDKTENNSEALVPFLTPKRGKVSKRKTSERTANRQEAPASPIAATIPKHARATKPLQNDIRCGPKSRS